MKYEIIAACIGFVLGGSIMALTLMPKIDYPTYIAQFTECIQTVRDSGELGHKEITACDKAADNQARTK